jgi:hypothetical protein
MLSKIEKADFAIETFQLASVLSADSTTYGYRINFHPDFWLIVARLVDGYVDAYPGAGKGARFFRMDSGTLRLPMPVQEWTLITSAATGWFSLYAVKNLDGFTIEE